MLCQTKQSKMQFPDTFAIQMKNPQKNSVNFLECGEIPKFQLTNCVNKQGKIVNICFELGYKRDEICMLANFYAFKQ